MLLSLVLLIAACCQTWAKDAHIKDFTRTRDRQQLIEALDQALDQRQAYIDARQHEIDALKLQLQRASTDAERLALYTTLYNRYGSYRTDSAFTYAERAYALALQSGNEVEQQHAAIDIAYCYCLSGLYHEGQMLMPRRQEVLPDVLLNYYIAQCSFLQWQSDFTTIPSLKSELHRQSMAYHDSILLTDPNPLHQLQERVQIDGMMSREEAIRRLEATIDSLPATEDYIRYMALMTGTIYQELGDTDRAINYYIVSAIADMQHGVMEHASLQRVATLLFEEGDVEHAYRYMDCCLKDAQLCGARLRALELQDNLPVIMAAYNDRLMSQQQRLRLMLITTLAMLVVVLLVSLRLNKMRRDLKRSGEQLMKANEQLTASHQQLEAALQQVRQSNEQLAQANQSLTESNRVKDSFVTQYMKQCRQGISQLQAYQQRLQRLATTHSTDHLLEAIRSTESLDPQLEAFYCDFDDTFLSLYPTFVDELNAMIPAEERYPQPAPTANSRGTLPTELRVFALMRLGVTDLDEVAAFLRCAPKTVLNYRSRLRQKVTIDKDKLDQWITQGQ